MWHDSLVPTTRQITGAPPSGWLAKLNPKLRTLNLAHKTQNSLGFSRTLSPATHNAFFDPRPLSCLLLLLSVLGLLPAPVWAIQTHGDPEGLYIHQLGHLLFLAAMVYIIWQIHRRKLTDHLGFRQLMRGAYLLAAWNLVAFIGHWAEEKLPREVFLPGAGYFFRQLEIRDLKALVYYLAKLDHLILVPALFFFYQGLRTFRRQPPPQEERL